MVLNIQIDEWTQERKMYNAFASSDFYQLLSLSMNPPTTELSDALKDGSYRQDCINILNKLSCEKQIINQLESEFTAIEENLDGIDLLLSTMRKEHTRLFSHPFNPKIGIYETMFLGTNVDNVILFVSPEALDAERCYQDAGIKLANKYHEPPDYLCTELEFMMYLYREKGMAMQKKDFEELAETQKQIDFFEKAHIRNWVPKFFDRVEKESDLRIYQLIAKIAKHGLAKMSATVDERARS